MFTCLIRSIILHIPVKLYLLRPKIKPANAGQRFLFNVEICFNRFLIFFLYLIAKRLNFLNLGVQGHGSKGKGHTKSWILTFSKDSDSLIFHSIDLTFHFLRGHDLKLSYMKFQLHPMKNEGVAGQTVTLIFRGQTFFRQLYFCQFFFYPLKLFFELETHSDCRIYNGLRKNNFLKT